MSTQTVYHIPSDKHPQTLYRVTHDNNHWTCTCLSWKKQYSPLHKRTCKHIVKINGKEAEEKRAPDSFHGFTKIKRLPRTLHSFKPMLYQTLQPDKAILLTSSLWYWSRKHDGIYARWDKGNLWSKGGLQLSIPPPWQSLLQKLHTSLVLEGEIVSKRLKRSDASQILYDDMYEPQHWIPLRFMIFDVVDRHKPFQKRLELLKQLEIPDNHFIKVVNYHILTPKRAISEWEKQLIYCKQHGLEGIVLRHPQNMYQAGRRSKTVLKSKPISKGIGMIIEPGVIEEKHTGQRFRTSQTKIPIKTYVTFDYSGRTETGKPEFPRNIQIKL